MSLGKKPWSFGYLKNQHLWDIMLVMLHIKLALLETDII